MNSDLEKQILKLKPGALPADLRERLRIEPELDQPVEKLPDPHPAPVRSITRKKPWIWISAATVTAAAACILIMISMNDHGDISNDGITEQASTDPEETQLLSIVRKKQTLLSSKVLATEEFEGKMWELAEEQWMDNTVAACSTLPVLVSAKEVRRKIVFRPVVFQ